MGTLRHFLQNFLRGKARPTQARPSRWTRRWQFEELEPRLLMDGPHSDSPTLLAEHLAVFNLVKYENVTTTAVVNGAWSDSTTWDRGVPTVGSNALIKEGVTVTLTNVHRPVMRTLRIDGTLQFATDVNTGMVVDTIVVDPRGTLTMGTAAKPVAANVEAKIIIADRGPIDVTWDPNQFSRGLIAHGNFSMYGAETTSFVSLGKTALKNDTKLVLADKPVGWDPGDRIIVSGVVAGARQDEELAIKDINGKVVTVSPLKFNHAPAESKFEVYVTNVSRNVVIESQNPYDVSRRGHTMFMHTPKVSIDYAGFYGLGRTDKRNPLHNVILDAKGAAIVGTGKNQVGRYAMHFHRTGLDHHSTPVHVHGSAVVDSPGWGFVNHSSYVNFTDNVAFDVVGAAFVTEVGNEIGSFVHNLAIRSEGSGAGIESRQDRQDFGHQGDGFWFQGAGIDVVNNIAVGQKHSGFVFFTRALNEPGLGTARFLSHNLVDESWAKGKEFIDVGSVPIRSFKGNTTYASGGTGMETWFHLLSANHTGRSVIDGFLSWNNRSTAIFTPYTNQATIKDSTLLGNLANPGGAGIDGNGVTRNIRYEDLRVEGFNVGLSAPVNGTNVVQGGKFTNLQSILITTAMSQNRVVTINDVKFGNLSNGALKGRAQFDIYLRGNYNPKERDITNFFNPDVILLGMVKVNDKQVYYNEQAAGFVPFKTGQAADYIPPELLDKTNQQLSDTYGLAIGGIVAPASAVQVSRINGVVGDPAKYQADLKLVSKKYTNQLFGYQLQYKDAAGKLVKDPQLENLREGWNLITRKIAGNVRTFLVYGDIIPPTFTLDPKQSLLINPIDLKAGIVIKGTVFDDSTGSQHFSHRFANLDKLPLQTRLDGSKFIVIGFTIRDRAGNATVVKLEITVDPKAPLQQDQGFRKLPPRELSVTLLALLGFKDDRP